MLTLKAKLVNIELCCILFVSCYANTLNGPLDYLSKYNISIITWIKIPEITLPFALGWVVLDRSGRHFELVLNFLRDGSVPLPEDHRELDEVLKEAQYYRVQGLVQHCLSVMQVNTWISFLWTLKKWNMYKFWHVFFTSRNKRMSLKVYAAYPWSPQPKKNRGWLLHVER